ncbi:MAG TPA: Wzz/FepE/Etk N-terminal domain-containing protein [Ferruginibacter sp.]|nr:Wzz/FepE/Etk N-terminal domain-containing protein [Ferruginibacter sp.]
MNSQELLISVLHKLKRYKIIILAAGALFAVLAFVYANGKRTTYTSKATLFPLLSPSDNTISNNMLQGILGLNDAPKSFSSEATINIIELAQSRRIRESVVTTRLSAFENKTIGELIINDINEHRPFYSSGTTVPKDSLALATKASEIIKADITAKMNKNGVLELYYTGTNESYITPISNVIADKLSKFYVELKRQKALDDYNFTLDKIDSLQKMINSEDRKAIAMQQRTMFTPAELLEYSIPKVNVASEKERVLRQRDMYINNRDEAVWRLQKVTPIIAMLDKPTAPFDVKKQPIILLMIIGFIGGCFIGMLALTGGILYRYCKNELYKSLFGKP